MNDYMHLCKMMLLKRTRASILMDMDKAVKMFGEMTLQNLIWIVAISSTGWFAVHQYDTYYEESSKPDYILKACLQAGIMAIIGFVFAMVYTEIWHSHNPPSGDYVLKDFMPVRLLFSSFVAGVLALMGGVMGYWFVKSNYESMFRKINIDCKYNDLHLPVGAAIYENGNKIGGNGKWITLFNRRHTLTVECDQLGAGKRLQSFDLDPVNEKSEIVEVAVQTA